MPHRRVEVTRDLHAPRAIGDALGQLAASDFARWQKDQRGQSRLRRVGRERGRRVALGGAGHRACAEAARHAHADGHAAILEAAGGILAFVLQIELIQPGIGADAPPASVIRCGANGMQRRIALSARDDALLWQRQCQLAIAPDAAASAARDRAEPLRECRAQGLSGEWLQRKGLWRDVEGGSAVAAEARAAPRSCGAAGRTGEGDAPQERGGFGDGAHARLPSSIWGAEVALSVADAPWREMSATMQRPLTPSVSAARASATRTRSASPPLTSASMDEPPPERQAPYAPAVRAAASNGRSAGKIRWR